MAGGEVARYGRVGQGRGPTGKTADAAAAAGTWNRGRVVPRHDRVDQGQNADPASGNASIQDATTLVAGVVVRHGRVGQGGGAEIQDAAAIAAATDLLAGAAVRHGGADQVERTAAAHREDAEGGRVVVADNGEAFDSNVGRDDR